MAEPFGQEPPPAPPPLAPPPPSSEAQADQMGAKSLMDKVKSALT